MKIIHTSDWHIGHVLYNWDRSDEHQYFFDKLTEIVSSEKPDLMIVCGDIFHTSAPSAGAQRMYIENMLRIHTAAPDMETVVIAGNHDSGTRLEVDRILWEKFNIHVIGNIDRTADCLKKHIIRIGHPVKGYVAAVPHCFPQNFPDMGEDMPREERPAAFCKALIEEVSRYNEDGLPVIMAAHSTVTGSNPRKQDIIVGGIDSLKLEELGNGYDYIALGHIHFPQNIGPKARYSGSPLPISFNEDYPHSVTVLEIDGHESKPRIKTIEIPVKREVITIPEGQAVTFDEALKMLEAMPDDKDAYIRLNVRVKQYGGADWTERAVNATKGKACRYCYILLESEKDAATDKDRTEFSHEELEKMNPLDIARIHWKEMNGSELGEELEEKLISVMDEKDDDEQ